MLTYDQKIEFHKRVCEVVDLGNELLNSDMPQPLVRFDLRGKDGGHANYNDGDMDLNFNAGLIVDNWDEYINQIIPHEVAHLLKNYVYGTERKGLYSPHGYYWQTIMRLLGVEPKRTHSLDTSKVAQPSRPKTKYIYMCPECRKELVITAVRHNKMQRGAKYYHCGRHLSDIRYVRKLGQVSFSEAVTHKKAGTTPKSVPKQAATKVPSEPKSGTKIAHALVIYKAMMESGLEEHKTRQSIIKALAGSMQITPHQAAGYYHQCKKRIG